MRLEAEYRALSVGPGLVDRSYRALLEIKGADRTTWLHNLTTNQVKNLNRGEGNDAFVLNVKGRILFDVNVLVRADSIWLDLDRCFLEAAKKHFSKYAIPKTFRLSIAAMNSDGSGLVHDRPWRFLPTRSQRRRHACTRTIDDQWIIRAGSDG
jgi:folate-binding Fe-S cluster repair protein YgfZ